MSAGVIHPLRHCRTLVVSLDSLSPSILPLVANPNGEVVARDSSRKTLLVWRADHLAADLYYGKNSQMCPTGYWVCEMVPVGLTGMRLGLTGSGCLRGREQKAPSDICDGRLVLEGCNGI